MSLLFVAGVHVFVEHFQEAGIFFTGFTVVNVFHGIKSETVHTAGNPSLCRICYRLIGGDSPA